MAYQKLQAGRALAVIPSNTINIPNVAAVSATGVTTAGTANKLTDGDASFLNNGKKQRQNLSPPQQPV